MNREYKIILSTSKDPHLNLAYEEFLLQSHKENFLLFYINGPSVVIGKHQNPWKEVDLGFCKQRNIPVLRRLTGGGAVFHDSGNINFSFIRNKEEELVDFKEHMLPMREALVSLGFPVIVTERNDIFSENKKVSGNAQHISNGAKRLIHHGTLLISSDLDLLRSSLKPKELNIETHAVGSVRSSVMNLNSYRESLTGESFVFELASVLRDLLGTPAPLQLDPATVPEAVDLAQRKYKDWSWNIGKTPAFRFRSALGDLVDVRLGIIQGILTDRLDKETCDMLEGCVYRRDELINLGIDSKTAAEICPES